MSDGSPDSDRRTADREFKESIREQLAVIRTTQRTHDLSLDRIEKRQEENQTKVEDRLETMEDLIKGGMGSAGFDERLRDVEKQTQKHDLVLEGDHGLRKEVERLTEDRQSRQEFRKQDLAFWGVVLVALISNFDKVSGLVGSFWRRLDNPPPIQITRTKPLRLDEMVKTGK